MVSPTGTNYAVGGANVIFSGPPPGNKPITSPFAVSPNFLGLIPDLNTQIDTYLSSNNVNPNAIHLIPGMGGNDALPFIIGICRSVNSNDLNSFLTVFTQQLPGFIDSVIGGIINGIKKLIAGGIKPENIIVTEIGLNLTQFEKLPLVKSLWYYLIPLFTSGAVKLFSPPLSPDKATAR